MGTVSASELMRSLLNTERPSMLARAIADLGRHSLAREVFHGRRGELRQRYREGQQEDQLGTLGLVVNVLVLWNTVYMQAALDQLRAESYQVNPDDTARLSPLGYKHFNFLGR